MQILRRLKNFRKGEPILASDMNAIVEAIKALAKGDHISTVGILKASADGRVTLKLPRGLNPGGIPNRPFEVRKTGPDTVKVTAGKCHWKGAWIDPTWLGGESFESDKTIASATETLQLRLDVSVDAEEISEDAVKIGWDVTVSYEGLPARSYEIDFTGETITESHTDAEIIIDIAEVTFASGKISAITQILDYNPVLPWGRDIATTLISGGTS